VGKPDKSGTISEPTTPSVAVAVLLPVMGSLLAPVVPVTVTLPNTIGVPVTLHVITAPGATVVGGFGAQE
jgi:hypothetical protein